jgi:LysM repeat protein
MATQTYTVKSGDTLSGIAKNAGVGINDITGYKSGNKNLIFPGETLTVNPTVKDVSADTSGAKSYASAMTDALGGNTGGTTSTKTDGTLSDSYLSTLRDTISGAQKTVSDSATALAGLKTKAYDDAYASSGLSDKKNQISTIDSTIATKKAERDAAIGKVRSNPGLSAALLTGTVGKLSDKANAEINDLIAQRNGLAGDYNTGLTEVSRKAATVTGDAETAYNTAVKALESVTGQAKDYQTALVDTLKNNQTQDYQDKSLAIALQNANTNAYRALNPSSASTEAWKLAISPLTGKPMYWYNGAGVTRPLTEADTAVAGGAPASGPAPAAVSADATAADTTSTPWYQSLLNALNPFKAAN